MLIWGARGMHLPLAPRPVARPVVLPAAAAASSCLVVRPAVAGSVVCAPPGAPAHTEHHGWHVDLGCPGGGQPTPPAHPS